MTVNFIIYYYNMKFIYIIHIHKKKLIDSMNN